MQLKQKINAEFIAAYKAGDKVRKDALGMLKTKITEIEKKDSREATDADVVSAVQQLVKQRQQTIDAYEKSPNMTETILDAIVKEKGELKILQEFLPKQMTSEEIDAEVQKILKESTEANNRKLNVVMKTFKKKYNGQYDSRIVKELTEMHLKTM
jgi:uncharacterized protein YqeY